MALPPEVNPQDFAEAIRRFRDMVGEAWVFTSDEDLGPYRDAYSPFKGDPELEIVASAAVAPANVEEVQAVMRAANELRIPIYPISTGMNLGYGGAAPNHSGSVTLDLKRMNRILEINEDNATCLVEPGVSYFDLHRHIQERGLDLWIDCPDPGWGSVIGNALDHGVGYTLNQYRDHFGAHCGMEVVLANGEVMRTGMGALPGSGNSWMEYGYGFGPTVDGLFAQGNFGVVTKMGFWLHPAPEAYRSGTVLVQKHQDIIPLVRIMSALTNGEIANGRANLAMPIARGPSDEEKERILARHGGPDPAELEAWGLRNNQPYWSCTFQFYGPRRIVDAAWDHAQEKLSVIDGATFEDTASYDLPLTQEQFNEVHRVTFGSPNLSIFSIGTRSETNPNPSEGHLWFSPIIPKSGEALIEAQRVLGQAFAEADLPIQAWSSMPNQFYRRSFMLLFGLPLSTDPEENRRTREHFRSLVRIAAEHGYGEYRTPPAFQDDVMGVYNFNDHALLRFCETIKDAVDPNGIIAAGRSGIWPRHLREG